MKYIILSLLVSLPFLSSYGAEEIFVAEDESLADRNSGRVRINGTLDDTRRGQWTNRGNSGTIGDGGAWHGFARYMMDKRDLFNKVDAATSITFTTGLIQKETADGVDAVNGGLDVDVYLALDPNGAFIPSGSLPTIFTAFDWANERGWGYPNTVHLGTIPKSHPMSDDLGGDDGILEVDHPAMNITYDITDTIKGWISNDLLTVNSTIAVGLVQRHAAIADDQGNAKFDDPNLFVKAMTVFEVSNAHLTISDEVAKGPEVFSEYDLVDGWVDTGDWLGQVEVTHYPWAYIWDLQAYAYAGGDAWFYVAK